METINEIDAMEVFSIGYKDISRSNSSSDNVDIISNYDIGSISGYSTLCMGTNHTWGNLSNSTGCNDADFIHHLRHPIYVLILLSAIYGAVFLCAIIGNISVLCVVIKDCRFHSGTYYLLANLSIADLLVAIVCHPINLFVNIFNGWQFGAFMCKAVPYLQGVAVCASVNTLVVIAIDRYVAICHVMRQRNTKRMAKIILFVIWLVALLLMTPWALYYNVQEYRSSLQVMDMCAVVFPEPDLFHRQTFFLGVIFLMCYALPLCFIVACYSMIGYRVWHRDAPGITSSRGVIEKSKIRVIKMLAVVVFLFMFSWMPLYIINLKLLFAEPEHDSSDFAFINQVVIPFAQWLGTSNSCMNPLVYCLFSQKIRGRIRAMICCARPETRSLYTSRSGNNSALHASTSTRDSILKTDTYTNGNSRQVRYYSGRSLYHNRSPRLDTQFVRANRSNNVQSTHV